MPAKGKTENLPSNRVETLPVLPYPLTLGQITWSDTFEQNTSGQIVYEGLLEGEAATIRDIYLAAPKVILFGIPFDTKRVSYDRVPGEAEGVDLDVYKITVSLEGKNLNAKTTTGAAAGADKKKPSGFINFANLGDFTALEERVKQSTLAIREANLRTANLQVTAKQGLLNALPANSPARAGLKAEITALLTQGIRVQSTFGTGAQLFTRHQIITDGANEIALTGTEYNEAELTWGDSQQVGEDEVGGPPRAVFKLREPVIETLEEYSDKYSNPPENTKVLRDDTKENYDESGEKKVYKSTTRVNGEISSEITETWGFAYLYKDVYSESEERVYSTSPGDYWGKVESRITDYKYTKTLPVQYQISITSGGKPVHAIVHPDYRSFANVQGGVGQMQYQSNAEFLTEINATGWKLTRLKKEDESRNSADPEDPYTTSGAFDFKKVPLTSRTINVLAAIKTKGTLAEGVNPPFAVEFTEYGSLDARLKKLVVAGAEAEKEKIAILTPDPNYVEPLYVKAELSGSSSFIGMDDPDAEAEGEEGENGEVKVPRLIAGEETRNEVERTIHGPNRYSERVTEYSSQDPGFDNAIEKIYFREMSGSPPSPQHRIAPYEKVDVDTLKIVNSFSSVKYLISTPGAATVEKGGSVSQSDATNLSEALAGFETDLRKESMSNSRSQKVLFGFHQNLRSGQPAVSEKDLFSGQGSWRITSVAWELTYNGLVDGLGLLVITNGTTVTLGLDKAKAYSIGTRTDASGGDNSGNGKVSVQVSGEGLAPQSLLPDLPSRRTNN